MSPHNAARHALIPSSTAMQIRWMNAKARLLRDALEGFGQKSRAIFNDVETVVGKKGLAKQAWPKESWAVVNTSASLVVREALTAASNDMLPARVVEAALYAQGQLGLIGTEGPRRNPNLGDVISEFYALCQGDDTLRPLVFSENADSQLIRTAIGEGCSSLTMTMSDGRLSLFAAGMSEYLLNCQREGLPAKGGEILIGLLDSLGLGVTWQRFEFPPLTSITAKNGVNWKVRIHGRAVEKIRDEVALWPTDETGGVLVGRLSEVTRTFNVVDVIPAPDDSTRSPTEFVLGTQGLRNALDDYAKSTGWALYCLGTWHSHLAPNGPSQVDKTCARAIALTRLAPSLLLIHTPTGFRALLADGSKMREAQ